MLPNYLLGLSLDRRFVSSLKKGILLTCCEEILFLSDCILCFSSYVCIEVISFDDAVVKNSEFVDFNKKEECDISKVCTFIERYTKLLKVEDRELDKVCEEFLDDQAMSRDEIPKDIWDDAVRYEDSVGSTKVTYHRMDRIWSHISQTKIPGRESARFTI